MSSLPLSHADPQNVGSDHASSIVILGPNDDTRNAPRNRHVVTFFLVCGLSDGSVTWGSLELHASGKNVTANFQTAVIGRRPVMCHAFPSFPDVNYGELSASSLYFIYILNIFCACSLLSPE